MVIWIIGLSGAGKSSIGKRLSQKLCEGGRSAVFMDGDMFRDIMRNDLGHTIEDRKKNADRICRFCESLDKQGVTIVFAILSLFHESQEWNRENISEYFEVYLDVSLDTVKRRDPKGLYRRFQKGEINNVAGIDVPFKPPKNPDMIVKNDQDTNKFDDIADKIIKALKDKGMV